MQIVWLVEVDDALWGVTENGKFVPADLNRTLRFEDGFELAITGMRAAATGGRVREGMEFLLRVEERRQADKLTGLFEAIKQIQEGRTAEGSKKRVA